MPRISASLLLLALSLSAAANAQQLFPRGTFMDKVTRAPGAAITEDVLPGVAPRPPNANPIQPDPSPANPCTKGPIICKDGNIR